FPSQAVIDDVKIFDYALSQAQVAWDYNRGAPYAWWKLDDNVSGRSKTINDSSGFGFNGTTDDGANNTGMDCTVEGKRNLGCDFDGVDDYIDLGTGLGFTSSFSAAGWIYLDENDITSPCDDAIINKNGGSGARDYSLLNECGAW